MVLTTDEVRKIASLARLRLTPEEEERFAVQLGQIVGYIDQLQELAPAAAAASGPEADDPGRHDDVPDGIDAVASCLPRELFLANAPAALDGFLLVPEIKGVERAEG